MLVVVLDCASYLLLLTNDTPVPFISVAMELGSGFSEKQSDPTLVPRERSHHHHHHHSLRRHVIGCSKMALLDDDNPDPIGDLGAFAPYSSWWWSKVASTTSDTICSTTTRPSPVSRHTVAKLKATYLDLQGRRNSFISGEAAKRNTRIKNLFAPFPQKITLVSL